MRVHKPSTVAISSPTSSSAIPVCVEDQSVVETTETVRVLPTDDRIYADPTSTWNLNRVLRLVRVPGRAIAVARIDA